MPDEEEHKEKPEDHKGDESKGGKGIGGSFQKHKTLWIVGGVGAAGVLLLLFMNSGGGSSSTPAASTDTSGTTTQGGGGAVDTSSLVGTGGQPSWYNPGTAENLDYWPYVPTSSSSGSSSSTSGSSSKKKKSSSGSSKSSSGGVSHGTSHGVSSGTKTSTHSSGKSTSSTKKKSTKANPHAGGAHGYVYTTKAGDTVSTLSVKAWKGSNQTGGKGNPNVYTYANNSKILKGKVNSKGQIKPGTKISL